MSAATPLLPEGTDAPTEPVLDSGRPWTFSVEARSIYDDNIFLGPEGTEQSDVVFLLAPSVTWRSGDIARRYGSYGIVSYTASASFFVDEGDENSLDHSFRADLQRRFGRLSAGIDGRYQRLSGATPELSDRVDRDEAAARLRLAYDIGGRTSIEASGGYSIVDYQDAGLTDYDEWLAEAFIGYQIGGRTRAALGGAVGQLNVDRGESQDFTRALLKVSTDPTGKFTLDAKGGAEFRDTAAGSETTPVYSLTGEYRPTGRTSVAAVVYREVTASGSIEHENVTRTGASLRVQQRLGQRFTASIEAGCENLDYDSTEAGAVASGRDDDYFFIRPSLRYELSEGRRAEIYYSLRRDDSSLSEFDFKANQAGLALGFDF
jgi:hypothetical protein